MSTVLQAYQFALDPTEARAAASSSHCGADRFAFNWGLARVKAVVDQRTAERSCGLAEADLTSAVNWSAYSLRKSWNQAKHEAAPWWSENSKEAYASGLANLATALDIWNKSRRGQRVGRKLGFPRFKSKRGRSSCRFSTGAFGLAKQDRRHVKLPRIGTARTHESTRKLARHVERGIARLRSATVAHRADRWHVSFSGEITESEPAGASRGGGPRGEVLGGVVLRGNHRQPQTPRSRPTGTAAVAAPSRPPVRTSAPSVRRRTGGVRRKLALPSCTRPWPTLVPMGCTSSPLGWCASSTRSSSTKRRRKVRSASTATTRVRTSSPTTTGWS